MDDINNKDIELNEGKKQETIKKETDEFSRNDKSAKNLGDGRWSYQGKIYKEERIGRS